MADDTINIFADRFIKKNGFLQIDDGTDKHRLQYVQLSRSSINLNSFEESYIDDQTPIFSQFSNVIGEGTIEFWDTVGMHDIVSPATNKQTVSYWREQISKGLPPTITFIETHNAPNSTGSKFDREKIGGRIETVDAETNTEQTLRKITLEIKITSYVSDIRSAT